MLDYKKLKPRLDLEGKYVDFSTIRTAVSVLTLLDCLDTKLSEPNSDGECRGNCPKCKKPRSFSLNTNTNRFNCFNKGCTFRGSGVIDFAAKLFEVTAKEASHLVACAYGIQPYSADDSGASSGDAGQTKPEAEESGEANKAEISENKNGDYVLRTEFEKLKTELDRFRNVVYVYMLENDQTVFESETVETLQPANRLQ